MLQHNSTSQTATESVMLKHNLRLTKADSLKWGLTRAPSGVRLKSGDMAGPCNTGALWFNDRIRRDERFASRRVFVRWVVVSYLTPRVIGVF